MYMLQFNDCTQRSVCKPIVSFSIHKLSLYGLDLHYTHIDWVYRKWYMPMPRNAKTRFNNLISHTNVYIYLYVRHTSYTISTYATTWPIALQCETDATRVGVLLASCVWKHLNSVLGQLQSCVAASDGTEVRISIICLTQFYARLTVTISDGIYTFIVVLVGKVSEWQATMRILMWPKWSEVEIGERKTPLIVTIYCLIGTTISCQTKPPISVVNRPAMAATVAAVVLHRTSGTVWSSKCACVR